MTFLDWLRSGKGGIDGDARLALAGVAPSPIPAPGSEERTADANGLHRFTSASQEQSETTNGIVRPRRWVSVQHHAAELLAILIRSGFACHEFHHAHLRNLYLGMCDELNWGRHGWNLVASEFKRITTGKKVYRLHRFDDGSQRKVRVYPITLRQPDEAAVAPMPQARTAA